VDGQSVVYAPDAGYAAALIPDEAIAFYRGADVLIHDATYSPEDWAQRRARGSSSISEAVVAAVRAGVRHLVLTHYDPDYGDDMVQALAEHARRLLDEQGIGDVRILVGGTIPLDDFGDFAVGQEEVWHRWVVVPAVSTGVDTRETRYYEATTGWLVGMELERTTDGSKRLDVLSDTNVSIPTH